jgi:hypothetical protein
MLKIEPTCWGLNPVLAFAALLLWVACTTWRDTMRMAEFMLDLPKSASAKYDLINPAAKRSAGRAGFPALCIARSQP